MSIVQQQVTLSDPHVATDNRDKLSILFSIYESLVSRRYDGGFAPGLADSWQASADARSWTFTLREEARFHNGKRVEAHDVVASLERVRDPHMGGELGTQGVYASYLAGADIQAVNRHTVRLTPSGPMADLLDLLVDLPVAPAALLDELPDAAVGSGPYRVIDRSEGCIIMEAFEGHWRGDSVLRRVVWQAEPDTRARVDALIEGGADLIADILPQNRATRTLLPSMLVTHPSPVCSAFMCNLESGVCTDRRVRQALNYALHVPSIIDEVLAGAATPLTGPVSHLHFGHDPATPIFGHDPARARELLADAGHRDGLSIVLDVPTVLPDEATAVAEIMAVQFRECGIFTTIVQHEDRPAYAGMVRNKRMHDAACFDSSPLSTWRVFREKFHSGLRGPWWLGYVNREVDDIIDRAQQTIDNSRRRALYRRAYRLIRDDAPWIFLFNSTLGWGVGPSFTRWRPTIAGHILPMRR